MEHWIISLVCPDGTHEPVHLKHKTPFSVGRIPEMRIVDSRCSRNQLQLTADCHHGEVTVKQLGGNSSALDGLEMIQGKEYKMKSTSTLYILTGQYPQKLKMVELNNTQNKSEKNCSTDTHKSKHEHHMVSKSEISPKTPDSSKRTPESTKTATKRRSSSSHNEGQFKKPRVSFAEKSEHHRKSSTNSELSSSKSHDESDEKHVQDVAAKLKLLKESAKDIVHPPSSSSSKVNKTSSAAPSASRPMPAASPAVSSQWNEHDSIYVYTSKGLQSRGKVAAFDIDGTIITTQSGNVFPKEPGDWRLLYHKELPRKIKKLHEDGFKIVFITNQMGVSKGKTKISDLKTKFEDVVDELSVPVQILVSTKGGLYRKPCTGMWTFLAEKGNDGIAIDVAKSMYVGDAAGRPKDWSRKRKKDFSSSDRLFALNIGLTFFTPEEYFLGRQTAKFVMPEFDPRKFSGKTPMFEHETSQLCSVSQEVIVCVGYPASGKSFFAKKYLEPKKYEHINRDTIGTWQKCVTACKEAIKKGKSVVVDNTNPDVESRARYVDAAKSRGLKCRCFLFDVSHMQARHNERFREITDKSHAAINDMVMNVYKNKYVVPQKKEGFSEIVKVNFVPKFTDQKLEQLYKMFLLEK